MDRNFLARNDSARFVEFMQLKYDAVNQFSEPEAGRIDVSVVIFSDF